MHAQYHRPRQQPSIQRRSSWSSNIAPVAVMRQVPPVEIETQHMNLTSNGSKASSQPISALAGRRPPPAYRGVLQADKSPTKARTISVPSPPSYTREHVSDVKPTVTMPVTVEHQESALDSRFSFTAPQIEKRLIVRFKLPRALLRSLCDAEAAAARLKRAFSTCSQPPDFSHISQDRSPATEPFGPDAYPQRVDVNLTGFKRPATSSSSYPPANLVVPSGTNQNSSRPSNGINTTQQTFVAKETAFGDDTNEPPASFHPQTQRTTMRTPSSSYPPSSVVPVNSIWSNVPVAHSNSQARRTISAESSSSSNTAASTHRSSSSSQSHITVTAPEKVLPGVVKRPTRQPSMGQEFSQFRPDENGGVAGEQHPIKSKKRVPQVHQNAPSTPSPPAKRVRSGSLFQPSTKADSSDDSDDDIPISQVRRREMRLASGSVRRPLANGSLRRRDRQLIDKDCDEEQLEEASPNLPRKVQDELRDDFRTRAQFTHVNDFLGTSPAKEATGVEVHAWINRSKLLAIDPSKFQYPIALKSKPGMFSVIENEADLREEIESERIRLDKSVSTTENTTPTPTSRTSTILPAPAPLPAGDTFTSELRERIELAHTNFAVELIIIQGMARQGGPIKRSERELDEIEHQARVWLESFKVAQSRFEAVCEKQGLFLPTTMLCHNEDSKLPVVYGDVVERKVDVKGGNAVGTQGKSTRENKQGGGAVLKKGVAVKKKMKKSKAVMIDMLD